MVLGSLNMTHALLCDPHNLWTLTRVTHCHLCMVTLVTGYKVTRLQCCSRFVPALPKSVLSHIYPYLDLINFQLVLLLLLLLVCLAVLFFLLPINSNQVIVNYCFHWRPEMQVCFRSHFALLFNGVVSFEENFRVYNLYFEIWVGAINGHDLWWLRIVFDRRSFS